METMKHVIKYNSWFNFWLASWARFSQLVIVIGLVLPLCSYSDTVTNLSSVSEWIDSVSAVREQAYMISQTSTDSNEVAEAEIVVAGTDQILATLNNNAYTDWEQNIEYINSNIQNIVNMLDPEFSNMYHDVSSILGNFYLYIDSFNSMAYDVTSILDILYNLNPLLTKITAGFPGLSLNKFCADIRFCADYFRYVFPQLMELLVDTATEILSTANAISNINFGVYTNLTGYSLLLKYLGEESSLVNWYSTGDLSYTLANYLVTSSGASLFSRFYPMVNWADISETLNGDGPYAYETNTAPYYLNQLYEIAKDITNRLDGFSFAVTNNLEFLSTNLASQTQTINVTLPEIVLKLTNIVDVLSEIQTDFNTDYTAPTQPDVPEEPFTYGLTNKFDIEIDNVPEYQPVDVDALNFDDLEFNPHDLVVIPAGTFFLPKLTLPLLGVCPWDEFHYPDDDIVLPFGPPTSGGDSKPLFDAITSIRVRYMPWLYWILIILAYKSLYFKAK